VLDGPTVRAITGFELQDVTRLAGGSGGTESARTLCVFADRSFDSVILGIAPPNPEAADRFEATVAAMSDPRRVPGPWESAAWEVIGYQGRLEVLREDRHLSLAVILSGVPPPSLLRMALTLASAVSTDG
jgi:hypothetical protein